MVDIENKENRDQDLGLGDRVIQEGRVRFINKDGSFSVYRKGMWERGAFSVYHAILNTTWPKFFAWLLGYYAVINIVFSFLYVLAGHAAFPDIAGLTIWQRYWQLFFYSVQVISTLGSSPLHPATTVSAILLAIESMIGLLGFAMAASLLFARFSNPPTKILFSDKAVIAPYKDITGFMIRIINGRSNELVDVKASVTLSLAGHDGKRKFFILPLERDSVATFPLNWTIVHPINQQSPLYGLRIQDMRSQQIEVVVNITAVDQDLAKTIYTRSSYSDGEIVNGKFTYIIERDQEGRIFVDPKRVSEIEPA